MFDWVLNVPLLWPPKPGFEHVLAKTAEGKTLCTAELNEENYKIEINTLVPVSGFSKMFFKIHFKFLLH